MNTGQREVLDAELDHKTRELDQSLMLLEDTVMGYQQQSEQLKLVLRATPKPKSCPPALSPNLWPWQGII